MSTRMQSLQFRRDIWTPILAMDWIEKNGFVPIKPVHITPHFLRYRLKQPEQGVMYRWVELGDGVYATYMY